MLDLDTCQQNTVFVAEEAICQCNELEWGKQEGQVNLSVPKGGCDSEGAGDDWGKGVAG